MVSNGVKAVKTWNDLVKKYFESIDGLVIYGIDDGRWNNIY